MTINYNYTLLCLRIIVLYFIMARLTAIMYRDNLYIVYPYMKQNVAFMIIVADALTRGRESP